ncbi:hypothetical protein BN000_03756 [Mycobacterium europaeum]|uniref:Uncharacterized protein n=2 Tax=Mycobacterium TaxID=1763 RepID=A0A0U0W2Q2_MYCBE|nr:hypothetical protein BN971_00381 [Mycobacterium bohemicum DSM 44277]CQD17260.1 hypothetical protein BN000_03756 [Mycobacterium europaeum]
MFIVAYGARAARLRYLGGCSQATNIKFRQWRDPARSTGPSRSRTVQHRLAPPAARPTPAGPFDVARFSGDDRLPAQAVLSAQTCPYSLWKFSACVIRNICLQPSIVIPDREVESQHRSNGELASAATAWAEDLPAAARAATEAFVYLMRQYRVRPYDIATTCSSRFADRDAPPAGRSHFEIVCHFDVAAPFWPLTADADQVCGYAISSDGHCIRYERTSFSISPYAFGFIEQRAEFAPGCREVIRRATASNPAFVCKVLPARSAVHVIAKYLIDAAVTLIERRGPLAVE